MTPGLDDVVALVETVAIASSPDEKVWLRAACDFAGTSGSAFAWNERKTAGEGRPSRDDSSRAVGVMFEQIQSQMAAVLEAVTSSTHRLEASMASLEARLRHDFDHREERTRMDALELRVAALENRLGVT
jgi:polyhydroxyalkanoate synthesis regulator phasin